MDLNTLRSLVTLLSLVVFLGIIAWTYASSRGADFEEAGRLPIGEETGVRGSTLRGGSDE